uniref:Uncharacterized protein n=1 Tax=Rhizophora mucronata TaxID=61149 RepID=A0A2P2R436_RHIMU
MKQKEKFTCYLDVVLPIVLEKICRSLLAIFI